MLSNVHWSWFFNSGYNSSDICICLGFLDKAGTLLLRDYVEPSLELSNTDIPEDSRADAGGKRDTSFIGFIIENRLWIIAISCVTQGIVKEGITLWGPSYLMETQGLDLGSTTTYVLLIPLMNFAGILFSGRLNKKFRYNHDLAIMTLLGASALAVLGLFPWAVCVGVMLLVAVQPACMGQTPSL